jgi:hypothetical protein
VGRYWKIRQPVAFSNQKKNAQTPQSVANTPVVLLIGNHSINASLSYR